jgi:hypothetical protein
MKSICLLLGIGLVSTWVGCSSTPVALTMVGPEPTSQKTQIVKGDGAAGCLQVFSDTKAHSIGSDLTYYRHMSYNIYDRAGKRVKYVPNHIGVTDEKPSLVTLPQGNYKVVAESSAYGRVTVPVVIQADKTTVLHLDRGWRPASNISSNEVVRFPDGEAVGWSTAITKASE